MGTHISRITFNMNKFIVAVALFGAVMGDGTGHGHTAPAASAAGYAAPADAYASPAAEGLDFDLSQITELIPLFVAVFAAIIVAQLVAPLFGALFGAKVTLFSGIFNPLGQIKFDLLNAVLNPLGYSLANCASTARPCTNNAMISAGKSLDSLNVIDMIEAASQIYEAMQ